MKTTVEISDALLNEAREIAARERVSVRALIEDGLRHVLAERHRSTQAFALRKAAFKGRGLRPEVADGGWDRMRDLAFEGRGA